MADTLEQEQADHAVTKTRLADVMGDGGSYRNLQARLDDVLAARTKIDEAHAQQVADIQEAHAQTVLDLKAAHEAALKAQAEQLATQHAAAVAELKEKTLLPAVRDLHARQASDLAAQQQAAADKLAAAQAQQLALVQ